MNNTMKFVLRVFVSIVVVSLPLAYILWQWRHAEHKELTSLTPEAFSEYIAGTDAPVFWAYAIWITILVAIVFTAIHLLSWFLGLVMCKKPKESAQ